MGVKLIHVSKMDLWFDLTGVHMLTKAVFSLCWIIYRYSDTDQSPGPVSQTFFARNSNSMETSPCCNSAAGDQIATNFCTCHDSTAVVSCTKLCSNHNYYNWDESETIAMKKKTLVERAPVHKGSTLHLQIPLDFGFHISKAPYRHQICTCKHKNTTDTCLKY